MTRFLHRFMHLWRYRNPYDRTCRVCGLHQQQYTYWTDPPGPTWWENMNEPENHHVHP